MLNSILKALLNGFLGNSIHHRLVNDVFVSDSYTDIWRSLRSKGFEPEQIVDAGAARGSWTTDLLKIYPDSKYLMIDPLVENREALQTIARSHSNVILWSGALGSKSGEIDIHVHKDQTSIFASEWSGVLREVPLRSLDSFLVDGTISEMSALKIDVQGAEYQVLEGASKLLEKCIAIQLEVSFRQVYDMAPLAHEIISLLGQKGFRIYDICESYKRPADRALMQSDFFFVSDNHYFQPEGFTC